MEEQWRVGGDGDQERERERVSEVTALSNNKG